MKKGIESRDFIPSCFQTYDFRIASLLQGYHVYFPLVDLKVRANSGKFAASMIAFKNDPTICQISNDRAVPVVCCPLNRSAVP